MERLNTLVDSLNDFLSIKTFQDYAPNGLQVAGTSDIKKIICGVTACQDLLNAAVIARADAVLVHHGYFWKGEDPCVVGMKGRRLKTLLDNNINLLAYHLPLDAHSEIGNSVQLAKILHIDITVPPAGDGIPPYFLQGEFSKTHSGQSLAEHIGLCLNRAPIHISSQSNQPIKKVAWVTGGGQDYIGLAARLGVDAFISGEISERTFHEAKECDIHYFAAGHHATERYGVQALAQHLTTTFDVDCEFIDIDNPV
jgi:dinuclear metal center YbgI/SA1388 family protein